MKRPGRFAFFEKLNIPIVVAFIGILSGVVGNWVGDYFSARREQSKNVSQWRIDAYKKFFSAQAKWLESQKPSLPERAQKLRDEYEQEIKEARFHIGVFGSPEVVLALEDWCEVVRTTEKGKPLPPEMDIRIYQAIRKEMLAEDGGVDDKKLYSLLFNYDAPGSAATSGKN